jgi:PhnB protein
MTDAPPLSPPGFTTVFPYFFMDDADGFCRFLVEGLGGREIGRHLDGDRIANAQVRLGDTTVMVSEAGRGFPSMPGSYYLYVKDADAAMARAIAAGAAEIAPVRDQPYGDRQGGLRDAWGNLWWISQRLVKGGYD